MPDHDDIDPPSAKPTDNPQPVDVVIHFQKIEEVLSQARSKTLTNALFADIISSLSLVKSAVIQCLSHAQNQSRPALPVAIPPPVVKPSAPYADALKRASTKAAPNTNIRTAVLNEMKKDTIRSLESSSAEHFCNLELHDQQKRKSNAIIYGISETKDAAETLDALLTTCAVTPPSIKPSITRLGTPQNDRPRPIRVGFTCEADAINLFGNLSALKGNDDFKGISVRYDLTPHQADIRRELAIAAKERSSDGKVFRVVGCPNEWRIIQARRTQPKP